MLAASRRPLLHDAKMTPEALLQALKDLANGRRWLYFCIVGTNMRKLQYTPLPHRADYKLPSDEDMLRQLKSWEPLGFLGVTIFGGSLQVFYRPLKAGVQTVEKLNKVGHETQAIIENHIQVDLRQLQSN